ncbi:MAG: amidohydrolase, partial [candidate division NC10 bacterium]|nr:amidohydrolase [candidate division NC10 bacterium]
ARLLAARRDRLPGAVKVMFQPAEEGPGGALPMLQAGVLEDPPVDAAFALHLWNEYPVGTVCVRAGAIMAAADRLRIIVRGSGGHAGRPHLAVDPVVAAAQMVLALQGLVAREVDPLKPVVVTVASIHGGDAFNVIPSEVTLGGTIRSLDPALREELPGRIRRLLTGIAEATRTAAEVEVEQRYPVTVNDPALVRLVAAAAEAVVGLERVVEHPPGMGAEDMAYVLHRVPGCYFFVGSANAARGLTAPHHSPRFDFDEEALSVGLEVMLRSAEGYLGGQGA